MAGWLQWLASGALPPSTLELRERQVRRLAYDHADRSPFDLEPADLAAWLTRYRWAPNTIRSHRAMVRSFYGWAHAAGLIGTDPSRLLRKVPVPAARPRPADDDVIAAAVTSADDRVYLMLMLGARHGLRRGEIARVHSDDLIATGRGSWSLLVHGKGGKDRIVPLLADVAAAIRERPAGWIFPGRTGSHLTPAHVGKLISRRLPTGTVPHQLRHRFASRAYQATGDIRAVQELLGHASVATTQIYTASAPGAHRAAVDAAAAIG